MRFIHVDELCRKTLLVVHGNCETEEYKLLLWIENYFLHGTAYSIIINHRRAVFRSRAAVRDRRSILLPVTIHPREEQ